MELHLTQNEVASDTHRFRVLCCGRRWGKTTLAVEEIKGLALSKNARIAYIAPTFQQARDIAWQMLIKELKPITKKINESRLELEVVNLKGGTSSIQLRGWEAIETLRGQFFDFIVIGSSFHEKLQCLLARGSETNADRYQRASDVYLYPERLQSLLRPV